MGQQVKRELKLKLMIKVKSMDAILKTGFEKINHSLNFHPQTVPKGKAIAV